MVRGLLTIALLLVSVVTACATPTPVTTGVQWDTYTDPNGVGFYIYWKDGGNATSAYSNQNRSQITDASRVSVLVDAIVQATHPTSLCFVLTAYDAAGNESGYSNEACGFVGMPSVSNVRSSR